MMVHRGPQRPHQLVRHHRDADHRQIPEQQPVKQEEIPQPDPQILVEEEHITDRNGKFQQPGRQGSVGRAPDPQRRRAEFPENQDIVQQHVGDQRRHIGNHRDPDAFYTPYRDVKHIGQPKEYIAVGNDPEILRPSGNDLRFVGKQPHEPFRHGQHRHCQQQSCQHGKTDNHGHDHPDRFELLHPPILGRQHSRPASQAEGQHIKNKKRLVRQRRRRHSHIPQLPQHDCIQHLG